MSRKFELFREITAKSGDISVLDACLDEIATLRSKLVEVEQELEVTRQEFGREQDRKLELALELERVKESSRSKIAELEEQLRQTSAYADRLADEKHELAAQVAELRPDAEAFRLMVEGEMITSISYCSQDVTVTTFKNGFKCVRTLFTPSSKYAGDPYASTREAIKKAAGETN